MNERLRPLSYAIYKGMSGKWGAVQFNLQSPHYVSKKNKDKDFTGSKFFNLPDEERKNWKTKEGCIFIDITSTEGKNKYDWANKIVFALSTGDIGKVLASISTGEELKMMHDPNAQSQMAGTIKKYMSISYPKGIKEGGILRIAQMVSGQRKEHVVPLSFSELLTLRCLFTKAISKTLNW